MSLSVPTLNVLVVYAHPEPTSFAAALKERAVADLTAAGHRVEVADLYAEGFDPVAGQGDFLERADDTRLHMQREQLHAVQTATLAADVRRELDRLEWADRVVFVAPLWWFGLPAMLKGWVDRVFVFGRVYGNGLTFGTGPLRGKKAMLALTTGGPQAAYSEGGLHGPIETLLHSVQHGVFRFTGMEAVEPFLAWGAGWVDDARREEYLDAFSARLTSLAYDEASAA
jgi:NAD(P)H dehydrogenase (quinone)